MPVLGSYPGKKVLKKLSLSKQFDASQGIFVNRRPDVIKEMKKNSMNLKVIKEWLRGGESRVPTHKLPQIKPDFEKFLAPSQDIKSIWFGHSTFLLRLNQMSILVDPVFSNYASPFSFMVKRFQKPVATLEQLPKIDIIVISHDHYDHLDMESIKFFKDKKTSFLVPLGVGEHLKGWGIESSRIIERDWWESYELEGVEFIATPAQHFSGRDGIHDNKTLWASWVLRTSNKSLFFSGDSGYDSHFKEIGSLYGPFDIAYIESGQYNESWKEVHMLPSEAAKAYTDLGAERYFPVHWAMFELAMHSWNDPVKQLSGLANEHNINLVTPKIGELIEVDSYQLKDNWWND